MPKKQVSQVKETAVAAAPTAKPRTPRIRAARHSKTPATVEAVAETLDIQPEPTHEAIAQVAYGYWEERGYQGGDAQDDWFRAEAELRRAAAH